MNTEALQSANVRPLELVGVTSVEVACSEIAIALLSMWNTMANQNLIDRRSVPNESDENHRSRVD